MRMYEELKAKYEIKDEEIMLDAVEVHWFGYSTQLEEDLLTQIFYKVTGSPVYKRSKSGIICTQTKQQGAIQKAKVNTNQQRKKNAWRKRLECIQCFWISEDRHRH